MTRQIKMYINFITCEISEIADEVAKILKRETK